MMSTDLLREFHAVREALKQEKQQIEARLAEINQAIGENNIRRGSRPRNEMSLKEAIVQAISKRPLTRHEVLDEVQKLGYQFASTNPLNSIGVVLYGKSPKFRNENGRFSLTAK